MGKLLPAYKKTIVDNIKTAISSNTVQYYAFASDPLETETIPAIPNNHLVSIQTRNYSMLFGKKIQESSFVPVIKNYTWTTNTVYTQYDNTSNTLANSQFYVVTEPNEIGGYYHIFKCICNNGGSASTEKPDQIQPETFSKSDGYKWRYLYTITSANYDKFATDDYIPVYANSSIQENSFLYLGIDKLVLSNTGSGYDAYKNGTIQSINPEGTIIQIENTASNLNDFYTDNAILVYENGSEPVTGQLKTITQYVSNNTGRWVYVNNAVSGFTSPLYRIAPRVVIETDGIEQPLAYSEVNPTVNAISSITIINTGYGISRANISIISNPTYGSGANAYAVVAPPGGHGFNPEAELFVQGFALSFQFSNSELNTISTDFRYNKFGIFEGPYEINQTTGLKTTNSYSSNTFESVLKGTVSSTFTIGDTVIGNTSGATAIVAFSNSSTVYLAGDKIFSNAEYIASSNGSVSSQLTINSRGDIYTKDIVPLYIENISDVQRTSEQTETYKLIITL